MRKAAATEPDARPAQRWDPERYARNARFVADLALPLLDMLAPAAGERILDLGCGDGALALRIAETGACVVAVDSSPRQVEAARARGLDARVMDGHALAFDAAFDGILTNAALHWMTRPDAVIDGMWRALRPGGRLIGEMGGEGNVAGITAALLRALAARGIDGESLFPWYFPAPEEYAGRLEARGFRIEAIERIERPTPLPGPLSDWLETFAESFLLAVPAGLRPGFVAEVVEDLAPELRSESGEWVADYVRLRFAARRPAA